MITNERQYRITKSQAERFSKALRDFNEIELVKQKIDPVIIAAQRASMEQQLNELQAEITTYEKLRSGRVQRLFPSNIPEIGEKLIEARISQGLSQKTLADRLGMREQQVQRYEQERYLTANLNRVAEVAEALHLDLFAFLETRHDTLLDKIAPNLKGLTDFDPSKLPVQEMKKRGWLKNLNIPPTMQVADVDLAAAFVSQAFQGNFAHSLHKQHVRMGSQQDPYALLAWKARVLHKARHVRLQPSSKTVDAHIIKQMVGLSAAPEGPAKAAEVLRAHGIVLVFERHLPSTHLDGAAMLLDQNTPVIGLTLRFDRLDNFWFVLLHEVGHIIRHRDRGLREGFFDEGEVASKDELEAEADEFANSAFIPNEVWKRSFVRFTRSSQEVHQFASQHRIGPAIVAGRIRRERGDYKVFTDLVGQGSVRNLLTASGQLEG
jgi:HTH-type transcriptional regulator/antitoxin HigA